MGKKPGAALCAALLLATAACGSSRPSADEVSTALQKGVTSTDKADKVRVPREQSDCTAKVLVASDISDADLRQLVDEHMLNASKANKLIIEKVSEDLQKCVA